MTLEARLAQLRAENHDESMAAAAERDALLRAVAESSEGNACLQNLVSCLQKGAEKRLAMATEEWQEKHSGLESRCTLQTAFIGRNIAAGVACLIVAQRRQVWSVARLVVQMMHEKCRLEGHILSTNVRLEQEELRAMKNNREQEFEMVRMRKLEVRPIFMRFSASDRGRAFLDLEHDLKSLMSACV